MRRPPKAVPLCSAFLIILYHKYVWIFSLSLSLSLYIYIYIYIYIIIIYISIYIYIYIYYIYIYIHIHSPNSLCCRGSGGVSSVLGICPSPISAPYVREILCAGAVNGDGRVAPVYAKVVARITFANKTHI